MTESIYADQLTKRFENAEAVTGISFSVRQGELFGFLGPNGAGKTTTINMLCTLLRPTAGSATVSGYDVEKQQDEVRQSIGLEDADDVLDDLDNALSPRLKTVTG